MKFADMKSGMYLLRTKELSWARVLSGAIVYLCEVRDGNLILQFTEDCVPKGKKMSMGKEGDDGCWYDATGLVMEANSAITPPSNVIAFKSSVASSYRNFLGLDKIPVVEGEAARGQICLLGETSPQGKVVFSKTGYYVLAYDNGWYIAYQGFCDYVPDGGEPATTLRILRLGENRNFYQAKPIIDACSAAYAEDIHLADKYSELIAKETSTEKEDPSVFERLDVSRLNLDGV